MKQPRTSILISLFFGLGMLAPGCAGSETPAPESPSRPAITGSGEWGEVQQGLRARLTCLEAGWTPGRPLRVRLEIENASEKAETYDDQQVGVNDPFEIVGPDGKRVAWVGGSVQTAGHPKDLAPGGRKTLLDEYDLEAGYLLTTAGTYTVRFRGSGGFGSAPIPPSNPIRIDTAGAPVISTERAFLADLAACLPARWEVGHQARAGERWIVSLLYVPPSHLKRDVIIVAIHWAPTRLDLRDLEAPEGAIAEYLGPRDDGHLHVVTGEAAEAVWPGHRAALVRALVGC